MWQFCLLMFLSFFLSFILFSHFLAVEKKIRLLRYSRLFIFVYGTLTATTTRIVLRDISLSSPINNMLLCRCLFVCLFFIFIFDRNQFHIPPHIDMVVCCLAYRIHVYITIPNLWSNRPNFFFLFFDNFDTKPKTKAMDRETESMLFLI